MKEVKLFMFAGCPHCRKAQKFIDELVSENPRYGEVGITVIDERKDPKTADKYDYYYVPTFYVDEEKIHEGTVTKEDVEKVFLAALED